MKRLVTRLMVCVAVLVGLAVVFVLWRDRPRTHSTGPRESQGAAQWRSVDGHYTGKTEYYSDGSSADTSGSHNDLRKAPVTASPPSQ